jgi:hypothetical protein
MDGVEALKGAIDSLSGGSQAGNDAKDVLQTLFGGLDTAGLVEGSSFDGSAKVVVTLKGEVVGEMATKSKVPYEVQLDKTMSAEVVPKSDGAIEVKMEGLFFAPPADAKPLFELVLAFKNTAAANKKMCQKECESDYDGIACESCAAYEWYKLHKAEVAAQDGKMARILSATPFSLKALSLEKEQGAWVPSSVGDKNRRRIIYSMLLAAPARFESFIFGTSLRTSVRLPKQPITRAKLTRPTKRSSTWRRSLSKISMGMVSCKRSLLRTGLQTSPSRSGRLL